MEGNSKIIQLSAKNRYVLVLDDDLTVHKYIQKCLGIPSQAFTSSELFLAKFKQLRPLGFFIDVHLGIENTNGIQLVPKIRAAFPSVPILVMTSDMEDDLIAKALEAGADDFIKKPIHVSELKARFNARLISIREKEKNSTIRFADLAFDPITGKLKGNGKRCILSPLEGKILSLLMKAQGEIVSKTILKQEAWGKEMVSDNALSRRVFEVREVIEETSRVLTLGASYGKGFRLTKKEKEHVKLPRAA